MIPLTAVMAVRIDSQERLENVIAVTNHILNHLDVERLIIVENDERPVVQGLVKNLYGDRVKYIFVEANLKAPWRKPRVLNTALPWIETKVTAIWDTDIVIPKDQLIGAVKFILEDTHDLVVPYTLFYHVLRKFIENVRTNTLDYEAMLADENNVVQTFNVPGAGCILYNTGVLRHVRGTNEHFVGWGGEDDEIVVRICKLPFKTIRIDGPLVHITHERLENSVPLKEYYEVKERELRRTLDEAPEVIAEYYGITPTIGDYSRFS